MQLELDIIVHIPVTSLTINFCIWKSSYRVPWPDVTLHVASVNKLSIHFCLLCVHQELNSIMGLGTQDLTYMSFLISSLDISSLCSARQMRGRLTGQSSYCQILGDCLIETLLNYYRLIIVPFFTYISLYFMYSL